MEDFDTRMLLKRTTEMVRHAPGVALIAWLALVLPSTLLSIATDGDSRFGFVSGIIGIFAQFMVTSRLARQAGLMQAESVPGRASSFVLLSIVTGLAIMLGFLVFVLPGLYLLARWSIAVPIVIAEGAKMGDALTASWERTRGKAVPICLALLVVGTGLLGSVALDYFYVPDYGTMPIIPMLVSDLIGFGSNVLAWFLAVAIYSFSAREAAPRLEEIFA